MKGGVDDDIDGLFMLPLAEFTDARNMLAARLKKEGRHNEAERVKMLSKPSVSAWTVNQLYWNHREALDQLIATGKRLRPPQSSRPGKGAGMRDSLEARRDAVNQLSDLATEVLQDAGHNPTQEMMRRIVTTIEAMAAYALLPNGPTPGRLTNDVDPPSFESLASLMSGSRAIHHVEELPSRKSGGVSPKKTQADNVRQIKEFRQAKIAEAKAALQDAKKSLTAARAKAESLESAQKKASAEAKDAEKQRRDAEERLKKATATSEEATKRARAVAAEVEVATTGLEDAKRSVETATKELESLLRG
jgi:hypothetical protein